MWNFLPKSAQGVRQWGLACLGALSMAAVPHARADMPFLSAANDAAFLAQNYAANASMASVANHQARRVARSAGRGATQTPSAPPPLVRGAPTRGASLSVGNDPRIAREVRQRFRAQLVSAHPTQQAAIDQALSQDWLQGYRREIARPNGLDADNVADAFTAYYVAAWAIVHGATTVSPAAVAAVRDPMRAAWTVSPAAAAMTAPQRQFAAQEAIYRTVLIMANRTHIHQTGNKALQQQAARHYQAQVLQGAGINLEQLRLTEAGFVAR
jgi:hypothetical protein